MKKDRERNIGAGRPFKLDLENRFFNAFGVLCCMIPYSKIQLSNVSNHHMKWSVYKQSLVRGKIILEFDAINN